MKHVAGGNCWEGISSPQEEDVCAKHEEPRGECGICPPCLACDERFDPRKPDPPRLIEPARKPNQPRGARWRANRRAAYDAERAVIKAARALVALTIEAEVAPLAEAVAQLEEAEKGYRHGHTSKHGRVTPEYRSWQNALQRCTNPKVALYRHYGGRGIRVCDRWYDFKNFIADMGLKPSQGYTLDRIDVDGDYDPANCRWVTRKEQNNNTSRNRYIEIDGERRTMAQWAELAGVNYWSFRTKLKRLPPAEALRQARSR
jgi:hypothetical protein